MASSGGGTIVIVVPAPCARIGAVMRRFGAVDVHYPDSGGARAALVVAPDAVFSRLVEEHCAWLSTALPYQPGSFYTRELPPIRAVLAMTAALDLLVVDGYVDLDPQGRPGLGAHVHAELGIPVVGVAKTSFRPATHAVPVLRGDSTRPLFVTAAGVDVEWAAAQVSSMSGAFRMPDALRRVDRLARSTRAGVVGRVRYGYETGVTDPNTSNFRDPERGEPLPDEDDGDFAAEHDDTSYADNSPGGLERAREPESPHGHAGMDL